MGIGEYRVIKDYSREEPELRYRLVKHVEMLASGKQYKMYSFQLDFSHIQSFVQRDRLGRIEKVTKVLPNIMPDGSKAFQECWAFLHSWDLLNSSEELRKFVYQFSDIQVHGNQNRTIILQPWFQGKTIDHFKREKEEERQKVLQSLLDLCNIFHQNSLAIHDLTIAREDQGGNVWFEASGLDGFQQIRCYLVDIEAICFFGENPKKARHFIPSFFINDESEWGRYGRESDTKQLLHIMAKEIGFLKLEEERKLAAQFTAGKPFNLFLPEREEAQDTEFLEEMIEEIPVPPQKSKRTEKTEEKPKEKKPKRRKRTRKKRAQKRKRPQFNLSPKMKRLLFILCFIFIATIAYYYFITKQKNGDFSQRVELEQAEQELLDILGEYNRGEATAEATHQKVRVLADQVMTVENEEAEGRKRERKKTELTQASVKGLILYWNGKKPNTIGGCDILAKLTGSPRTGVIREFSDCAIDQKLALELLEKTPNTLGTQLAYSLWGTATCIEKKNPDICMKTAAISENLLVADDIPKWLKADVALNYALEAVWSHNLKFSFDINFDQGCAEIIASSASLFDLDNTHLATKRCLRVASSDEQWLDWAIMYKSIYLAKEYDKKKIRTNLISSVPNRECSGVYVSSKKRKASSKQSFCSWTVGAIMREKIGTLPTGLDLPLYCLICSDNFCPECKIEEDSFGWKDMRTLLKGKGYPQME